MPSPNIEAIRVILEQMKAIAPNAEIDRLSDELMTQVRCAAIPQITNPSTAFAKDHTGKEVMFVW